MYIVLDKQNTRQRIDEQQSEKGTQRVTAIHQIINSSSIFSAYCCGYGMPAEWLIDGPMTSTSDIIISNVIELAIQELPCCA